MNNQIVLSGIRATGSLHFGSLLGAVQHFVRLQERPDAQGLYFIADLHSLTTLSDPELLRTSLIEIVKDYLAAGLDPERSIIYAQSSVPAIPELALFLSMMQPVGALQTIPTFKEKIRSQPQNVNLGLLSYPVLMAADILGPKANIVPVGEDQKPNVELARDLARIFNNRFGDTFVIPEMLEEMIKVPGLDGGKMGKSDAKNAVGINMTKAEVLTRYKKFGITDPERGHVTDPGDPYNRCLSVYAVHELVTRGEVESRAIANQCISGTIGCSDCKALLVDSLFDILGPFQERRATFANQDHLVVEVLHEGGKKARAIIDPTVAEVADKMGVRRF